MERRWFVKRTNPDFINYLAKNSSISPILAQVLVNRGIKTPEETNAFLNPVIDSMADPLSLTDMDKAVARIRKAAADGEAVLVHGDYDTDGLTSASIVLLALKKLGIGCDFFIPNRFDHGYGFNMEAVDLAERIRAKLIITVDCGISAFDEVREAKRRGIDVIVTDHHEPSTDETGLFVLPGADAIINPRLMGPGRSFFLCGAGVALKLSQALLGFDESLEFFDLAAIGTIADMVPLLYDNRIIVKEGLDLIAKGGRESIAALKDISALRDRTVTAGLLSFTMIPRLNASGRIGEASEVVELFVSDSCENACRIAKQLNTTNSRRQKIEETVYKEALSMLRETAYDNCIVLHKEQWHEGVLGIVASKIADSFRRPTFIFSVKNGVAKGSARSTPAFDIYDGLTLCSEYLMRYGGHKQAAGLTMRAEHLRDFENKMNELISASIEEHEPTSGLQIDAEVNLREITLPFVRELSKLEPFGLGNQEPLLAAKGIEVIGERIVGNNHLKMTLRHRSCAIDAIGFEMGKTYESMESSGAIDAVFVPTINEWNGNRRIQLNVKAIRPSH